MAHEQNEEVKNVVEVGVGSIADDMLDSMPDPTNLSPRVGGGENGAIAADPPPSPADGETPPENVSTQNSEQSERVIIDPKNPPSDFDPKKFDPKYHQPGPDGKGILNKDGTYRRHGGRPKKQAPKSVVNIPGPEPEKPEMPEAEPGPVPPETPQIAEAVLVGKTAAHLTFAVGAFIGKMTGDDGGAWQPTPDESISLEQAWTTYLDSIGVDEITPGAGLAMAIGLYAAPRVVRPKPLSAWQKAVFWLKMKIFSRGRGNAHVDSGNNIERQEHGSETDNQAVSREGSFLSGL